VGEKGQLRSDLVRKDSAQEQPRHRTERVIACSAKVRLGRHPTSHRRILSPTNAHWPREVVTAERSAGHDTCEGSLTQRVLCMCVMHSPLPQSVDAHTHGVVHLVVRWRYLLEHLTHHPCNHDHACAQCAVSVDHARGRCKCRGQVPTLSGCVSMICVWEQVHVDEDEMATCRTCPPTHTTALNEMSVSCEVA
jgi:hypothetical protein